VISDDSNGNAAENLSTRNWTTVSDCINKT